MNDLTFFTTTLRAQSPSLNADDIEALVRKQYGVEARAERLTGERDENFRMRTADGPGYVLKVAPAGESPSVASLPAAVLLHLERVAEDLPAPRLVRSLDGRAQIQVSDAGGEIRTAALCTFLPGKLLSSTTRSSAQRSACGKLLGRLARALRTFDHDASRRAIPWDLAQLPRLAGLIPAVPDLPEAPFLENFVAQFTSRIAPRLTAVRHQFVHNDFNARNIIIGATDESQVVGIIDFGDAVYTALVADVAVGVMGQLATPDTADDAIREFVQAYCDIEPLVVEEMAILKWLIAGRIVQNVVITAWHRARHPSTKHFDGYDATFFGWRIDLAKRLAFGSDPRRTPGL